MKKYISLLLITFFCGFSITSLAQDNLKSSKILYDKGLEEIYDVQEYNGGYIALGHKGDEATTKKLWLIKFDKDLNVIGSKVIFNQELVSPFRLQKLSNGNVLVLAQDASQKVQNSVLFCLHPEGAISWSKRFSSALNIELSDMLVTKDQTVYLYGAKKHIINTMPNNDIALLIKIDQLGNQQWQKEIEMGAVELRTKQLMLDRNNNLLLTGTLIDISDIPSAKIAHTISQVAESIDIPADTVYIEDPVTGQLEMRVVTKEVKRSKTKAVEMNDRVSALGQFYKEIIYTGKDNADPFSIAYQKQMPRNTFFVEDALTRKLVMRLVKREVESVEVIRSVDNKRNETNGIINFYAMQVSLAGEVLHKTAVNGYADYSFSNAVVENDNGYLFLLQSANYFGDGLILQTDKNLNALSKQTLTGSPMLYSGLFKQNDNYVIGGVFSNTLKDYSPGFVLLNNELEVLQAKSSKSLFSHFFISNIAPMHDQRFMLSGIGYEQNQPSDIYFLPFTSDGKSACELASYEMKIEAVKDESLFEFTTKVQSNNGVVISDAQFALADDNKFTSGNVCTTPDENPVDNKENGSWNQWNHKNADAFSMKIPTNWIQVSPNPSEGEFTVQYDGMQNEGGLKIYVTDMNGRMVHSQFLQNQDVFKLNLRKLGPGVYNLQINDGFKSQTKKITVVK